jgi:ABC-type sugar transport system ATPase subunit
MGRGRGVLVLDEPTAELAPQESNRVFEIISNLAMRGAGVVFIAHNLTDVMQVAETVTVLRDGRVVACVKSKSSSVEELAGFMFGSSTELILDSSKEEEDTVSPSLAPKAVEASRFTPAIRLSGIFASRLKDVNVDIWPGEIVGVTGLIGCGKSEMGRVITGVQTPNSGTLSVFGALMTHHSPHAALGAGVAYVPADRRRFGGILTMDARENVTLTTVNSFFARGWLRKGRELKSVAEQMVEVGAVPSDPRRIFETFSGGNQQKLVFARAQRSSPRVVVLDEPTHGVDVSTIPELYRMVREMAHRGCGVLLITSDLDELVALSDRVIVLSDGRCTDELSGDDVSVERIGLVVSRGHVQGDS